MDVTQFLGPVGVAVSIIAAYFAYRNSARSTNVQEFDSLRDELRKQLADEKSERLDDRQLFEDRIAGLENRVVSAEAAQKTSDNKLRLAVAYIQMLRGVMRESGLTVPPPPHELELD